MCDGGALGFILFLYRFEPSNSKSHIKTRLTSELDKAVSSITQSLLNCHNTADGVYKRGAYQGLANDQHSQMNFLSLRDTDFCR